MKTKTKVAAGVFAISMIFLLSCIPENVKEEMSKNLQEAQIMFADQEFKKAIGHIELHKLRNGDYPESLRELEFLSAMDSTMFAYVNYTRMDSGYELNINFKMASISGKKTTAQLNYPPEFWRGLGCVRSNAK